MNYETKFNVGDMVWIMFENKPFRGKVEAVKLHKTSTCPGGIEKVYLSVPKISNGEDGGRYIDKVFRSKEDLIASL